MVACVLSEEYTSVSLLLKPHALFAGCVALTWPFFVCVCVWVVLLMSLLRRPITGRSQKCKRNEWFT